MERSRSRSKVRAAQNSEQDRRMSFCDKESLIRIKALSAESLRDEAISQRAESSVKALREFMRPFGKKMDSHEYISIYQGQIEKQRCM